MKLLTQSALTFNSRAECVTIVSLIQTLCMRMIKQISVPTIRSNSFSFSCNSLHSGSICQKLQQWNSMMLRKISIQRWYHATRGGMNRYRSWILSFQQWLWQLQLLWWLLWCTIICLFNSLDQTHLTKWLGNQDEWLVQLSLGNIDLMIRLKPSNLANISVAHLPVAPKYQFKEHGYATTMKEQQIHIQEVLSNVIDLIFRPLKNYLHTGHQMYCADGRMWQCYSVISA